MVKRIQTLPGVKPTALQRELHHALHVAEKRTPTEDDAPKPKPFPGRKIEPTPGQLRIEDA